MPDYAELRTERVRDLDGNRIYARFHKSPEEPSGRMMVGYDRDWRMAVENLRREIEHDLSNPKLVKLAKSRLEAIDKAIAKQDRLIQSIKNKFKEDGIPVEE